MPNLIIGSRGSKLAMWQSNWVKDRLEEAYPGLVVNIEIIKTTGDKLTEASLAQIGGKGVFTKEIEEALLEGRVDLAVHSLKDLPTTLPAGLHIAAVTEREDVRDALIVREALRESVKSIKDLPEGARVGTSSLRRASQLRHARPDLRIVELRGNVETRLRKLDEGDYDAIILASAGLNRLGFSGRVSAHIPTSEMLTAVGQGALGIEARIDDHRANLLLEVLNHTPTRFATEAERAVLRSLGGGCAVPIAAFGHIKKNRLSQKLIVDALVADAEGRRVIRLQIGGPVQQAEELGAKLAENLIAEGARELLPGIGAQQPVSVEAAGGKPGVETRAEPLAQAAVAAPPESGTTNKPVAPPEVEPAKIVSVSASLLENEIKAKTASDESRPPLAGRRVIVTRAIKQSGEMTRALEHLGAEVIACPTIEIREPSNWAQLDRALIHLSWYDWLVFTSANGVEYFLRRLDQLGHGRAELMPHRVCAVGRKTAEKLKSENIVVDLTPERFTAEAVVEEFIKRFGVRQRLRGSRMLLPASRTTRDVIRPAMEKIGVHVEVVEAYQTVTPAKTGEDVAKLFHNAEADYIIFTSPSTVANLAAILETDHLAPLLANTRVACIGPVTADAARLHGLTVHIQPEEHTGQAVVTAIVADSFERRPAAGSSS
ncbi:MAG: Porphobilinogen deaminase [Acidobacteria bacterium]|nr:Porphobilinogen deaminase [Acidobacteriota bacterium]